MSSVNCVFAFFPIPTSSLTVYLNTPQKDTEIYQNAKILEDFFEQLLEKWLTDYAFDTMDAVQDPDTPEPKKKKKPKEVDGIFHFH